MPLPKSIFGRFPSFREPDTTDTAFESTAKLPVLLQIGAERHNNQLLKIKIGFIPPTRTGLQVRHTNGYNGQWRCRWRTKFWNNTCRTCLGKSPHSLLNSCIWTWSRHDHALHQAKRPKQLNCHQAVFILCLPAVIKGWKSGFGILGVGTVKVLPNCSKMTTDWHTDNRHRKIYGLVNDGSLWNSNRCVDWWPMVVF